MCCSSSRATRRTAGGRSFRRRRGVRCIRLRSGPRRSGGRAADSRRTRRSRTLAKAPRRRRRRLQPQLWKVLSFSCRYYTLFARCPQIILWGDTQSSKEAASKVSTVRCDDGDCRGHSLTSNGFSSGTLAKSLCQVSIILLGDTAFSAYSGIIRHNFGIS